MSSSKQVRGRVVVPPSKSGKGRIVGFAIGAALLVGLIAVFALGSADKAGETEASGQQDEGSFPTPRIVNGVPVPASAAGAVSGLPERSIEGRNIPPELEGKARNWSPESTEFRMPEPGEEAPVRAHNLDTYDPTKPGPPPNPFIPPKRHLTEEDTRAGLDPVPAQ